LQRRAQAAGPPLSWKRRRSGAAHRRCFGARQGEGLRRARTPFTLLAALLVGADRIAANGDVANKIGTYGLAVLCRAHKVPFYVAAPLSSIDPLVRTGKAIPIEERDGREVTHFLGTRIAPDGIDVYNPAFDVTPAKYVTAIVTERGVLRPPFPGAIRRLFR